MTPSHHLPAELLFDHAAGTLDPALAVLVDGHLALCLQCRVKAQECLAVGGGLLDAIEPVAMSEGAFDRLMARIDNGDVTWFDTPKPAAPSFGEETTDALIDVLPPALRPLGRRSLATRRWRSIAPGVKTLQLDLPTGHQGSAQIIRVDAGKGVPHHTHLGNEYTLVLSGAFNDHSGRFARGDLQITDASVKHRPIAEPGETCMVLAVTDGPLRLTGALGFIQRSLGY
ncbi:MAG: ChrR family anti-sigma-E factor [Zavarzinia sp.]|nr:ChrR family anti-sigma-E factor [Zavarzinia sp.]